MKEKVELIDLIIQRHPSRGVDKGWSYYAGGIADTGDWYFRKMLDAPIEELMVFLNDMISEENIPEIPLTMQEIADSKIIHKLPNGGFITEKDKKVWEKIHKDAEYKALFGNSKID